MGGVSYLDLTGFSAASGLETNGQSVDKDLCFATFNVSRSVSSVSSTAVYDAQGGV